MFGLAARTPHLRIETRARNAVSALLPDAGGRMPQARHICPGEAALSGRAHFQKLANAARVARVPARLSRDAGSYLCNYAYWRGIEATTRNDAVVVFVHVPRLGRPRAGKRALTLADLARAAEAILLALVSAAQANGRARRVRHAGQDRLKVGR
jgi:pyroglutamyl-peptidase